MSKQNHETEPLVARAERADQALLAIGGKEALAESARLNAAVVAYDLARTALKQAPSVLQADQQAEQALADLAAVLAALPAAGRVLGGARLGELPSPEGLVHTDPVYQAGAYLQVLREGGKESQLLGLLVERASERYQAAKEGGRAAETAVQRARDGVVGRRKELIAASSAAEAFVHLTTPGNHPARQHIKRPRKLQEGQSQGQSSASSATAGGKPAEPAANSDPAQGAAPKAVS